MTDHAFTAPSAEAVDAGMALLADGASAIEAMVGAAATIAVSYPHMNSLGGDGFWLIVPARGKPRGVLAGGASGAAVDAGLWAHGQPTRGVAAMLTLPGAVSGWQQALRINDELGAAPRPLAEILGDAIGRARDGIVAGRSLRQTVADKYAELEGQPGFAALFGAVARQQVERLHNPDLADLLERLAATGLDDFYRGDIGAAIGRGLAELGSVLTAADLADCRARVVEPLMLETAGHRVLNLPAPTQGLASLLIISQYQRHRHLAQSEADHVHLLVEATKRAFAVRDREIGDPDSARIDYAAALSLRQPATLREGIDMSRAATWPGPGDPGDTVWMGALDRHGNMVSYIQSLYWEFGSGVVIPGTGLLWNNRGLCFDRHPGGVNGIGPGRVPRHTLNPAAALMADGRRMVYGTMGGDGQPQTQSALWYRMTVEGMDPAAAVAAPRWLLGRTWGDAENNLKLEHSLASRILPDLAGRGHDVVEVADRSDVMGHAGVIVQQADGRCAAGGDPRSDGGARSGSAE